MRSKTIGLVGIILVSGLMSKTVNAQETALENVLSRMLMQTVAMTSTEIQNGVKQSIAQAVYSVQPSQDEPSVRTKIVITELTQSEIKSNDGDAE